MAQENATQSAPSSASVSNPFALGFELWNQLAQQQLQRWQNVQRDFVELESMGYERARQVGVAMTAVFDENLAYMSELAAKWRAANSF